MTSKTNSRGSKGTYSLGHKAGTSTAGNAHGLARHFGPVKPIAEGKATSRVTGNGATGVVGGWSAPKADC